MSWVTAIPPDGVSLGPESNQVAALMAALRATLLRQGDDEQANARSILFGGGMLPATISSNCPSLQSKEVKASNVLTCPMDQQRHLP